MPVATRPTSIEARERALEAADKLRELESAPADKRGTDHDAEIRKARGAVLNADALFDVTAKAEKHEAEQRAWEDAVAAFERGEIRGPSAAFAPVGQIEARSAGLDFVDRDEYREWAKSDRSYSRFPQQELRGSLFSETRALLDSGTADGDAGLLRPVGQPTMPSQTIRRQRLFIRDVINVVPTGLAVVPYVQELNPLTNETGATAVAEGTAKPEVTMEFTAASATITKIAAWIPVTEEILSDAPTLRGYIDSRLAYMLALREEAQILNGPGTTVNLRGIRQTSGLQTQNVVAGDFPATIGLAIAKVENVDGSADAVAVNPLNFWVALTTRHSSTFDNGYGGNAPAQASSVTWGLPAIRTRSMESGKALVGDFLMGATLLDRLRTTIRTSDSHDDYFVNNKIAVLAEERVGLAVHRPDFFVEATVPTT